MSRVYEALKRAESQRAQVEVGKAERSAGSEMARPRPPDSRILLSAPLPTMPKQAVPGVLGKHGPTLVVGRSDPNYMKAAEEFHLFAAGLQNWAVDHDKRVFMLTSAVSGEGKSFIALNLAASLVGIGNRVILVDADLRAPTLHRAFDIVPLRGLINYLTDDAQFQACLHSTPIDGLLLVPAGGTSYTPTEALARPRMRQFITEAQATTPPHYIIIDAPAASAVPEAQILNRLVDALLVVVRANHTPREIVKQTIERAAGTPIFGIVLNRFQPPHSAAANYPYKYAVPKPFDCADVE
jgi:capsular exopolysaccharide synthesis family protein